VAASCLIDDAMAFADIVYADADLLLAEFEQVVSDLLITVSTCTATAPPAVGDHATVRRCLTAGAESPRPEELPERVRAPPTRRGRRGRRHDHPHRTARHAVTHRKEKPAMSMSFDPFSQLDRIAQSVFDTSRQPRLMPVDLFREGDRYVLNADLPGVDPGSVDVDVDGHLLTIRAERTEANRDNSRWLAQERPFGSYVRRFTIGDDVDAQGISATYDNGVLSVVIPIAERAKPRKIQIESMGAHGAKAVTA